MTTQVEQTLNVTVAQIEDALLRGETVPDFAREWQEPPANVLAIYRRLQREGRIPVNGPAQVATARAAAPAKPSLAVLRDEARTVVQPRAEFKERATNAVELLARADHIDDRRIKAALGRARKAMTDLAGLVRKYEENSATRARIAELEAELRALRSSNRGGVSSMPQRETTDAKRAAMAKAQDAQRGEWPCSKCSRICTTKAGLSAHERACTGAS